MFRIQIDDCDIGTCPRVDGFVGKETNNKPTPGNYPRRVTRQHRLHAMHHVLVNIHICGRQPA